MVDARIRRLRHFRLGVKGDAETRLAQHVKIIGAVADRQRRVLRQPSRRAQFDERRALGFASQDRRDDRARSARRQTISR